MKEMSTMDPTELLEETTDLLVDCLEFITKTQNRKWRF